MKLSRDGQSEEKAFIHFRIFSIFVFFSLYQIDLCHLHLTSLDVSCNRIASLPVELRLMTELESLELQNNPLTSPPASVSYHGVFNRGEHR